jgi:hypothetical protein
VAAIAKIALASRMFDRLITVSASASARPIVTGTGAGRDQ